MGNRSFVRSEKNLYSNEEKLELSELVERLKRDYDNEKKLNAGKTRYDSKRFLVISQLLLFPIISLHTRLWDCVTAEYRCR